MRMALTMVVLLCPVAGIMAQDTPLMQGARVRVTPVTPPGDARVGMYQGLGGDGLRVALDSRTTTFPLSNITLLEVSRGRKPSVLATAVSALVGAGVGAFMLGCVANQDDYAVLCAGQDDTKFWGGAALGAATFGFIATRLFRSERWSPVDLRRLSGGSGTR